MSEFHAIPYVGGTGPVMNTTVDIALPVLNEEQSLAGSVCRLIDELSECPYDWTVSIVDNGSTDGSWSVASRLARMTAGVRALRLEQPGRGGALRTAWTTSTADVLAYMDIDLSTDLSALKPLLDPVVRGLADVSIGSRLDPASHVERSIRREAISHLYNGIARALLRYGVRDAQCGFKAVSREVVESIVPSVVDESWFFDTELLVLAARRGFRIHEIPVVWIEDVDSRVRIVSTAIDDLRGILRVMPRRRSAGPASLTKEVVELRIAELVVGPTRSSSRTSRSASDSGAGR